MKVFTFNQWLESKQWDKYSYANATINNKEALKIHYEKYISRNRA